MPLIYTTLLEFYRKISFPLKPTILATHHNISFLACLKSILYVLL